MSAPGNYDEFSMLADNAAEAGLAHDALPAVRRESIALPSGKNLSALVWGTGEPELVLLHGGAQNAHTWDTLALALGRPLVAIDLPGHGHSDWRDEHDYWPPSMADDVAVAVAQLAPNAKAVVGMSLGGLTAICLAAQHPSLVRRLGIVDVTPGTDHKKAEGIIAFISGPEYFDDFATILARTVEHNPTRTESSLRRGVLHNARQLDDGRWSWRYDPARGWKSGAAEAPVSEYFSPLWAHIDDVVVPITLYLGSVSPVVGPEDVEELVRRQPTTVVHTIDGAGHSIQGDRPLVLATMFAELLAS
jgi:pimeloyl-ACP methyl ester carboxylesterase